MRLPPQVESVDRFGDKDKDARTCSDQYAAPAVPLGAQTCGAGG